MTLSIRCSFSLGSGAVRSWRGLAALLLLSPLALLMTGFGTPFAVNVGFSQDVRLANLRGADRANTITDNSKSYDLEDTNHTDHDATTATTPAIAHYSLFRRGNAIPILS